jgi:hypothetical protein
MDMAEDSSAIQLRLPREMLREIRDVSAKLKLKETDVVRGSLHIGLPMFAAVAGAQEEVIKRMVKSLKKAARGRKIRPDRSTG